MFILKPSPQGRDYFPVIKSLTILPTTVTPKIMPVAIARQTAKKRVNLNTRKKMGINSEQSSMVRQPVAKSLVSNIKVFLSSHIPFHRESFYKL
jgi:hypothetical protein